MSDTQEEIIDELREHIRDLEKDCEQWENLNHESVQDIVNDNKSFKKKIAELEKYKSQAEPIIKSEQARVKYWKGEIKRLEANQCHCPTCGTTELLCGHNGVGCIKGKENERN